MLLEVVLLEHLHPELVNPVWVWEHERKAEEFVLVHIKLNNLVLEVGIFWHEQVQEKVSVDSEDPLFRVGLSI